MENLGQANSDSGLVSDPAVAHMDRVKAALDGAGIRFLDIGQIGIGVGVAVAFGETDYVVVSIMAGRVEGLLYLTSGVLKDISADRLAILERCNSITRNNVTYPVFLDDAEDGWDVLLQQRFPIDRLLADLSIFKSCVEELPGWARYARQQFAMVGLHAQVHALNTTDICRLLLRSVM